ncbi:MAG: DUF6482 family protein [Pseudomonadota bacterium]
MKITLSELKDLPIEKLIIESVDLSLYIAHALVNGERRLIAQRDGTTLKTKNLLEMKKKLRPLHAPSTVLTQRSSYDEMVGQGFPPSDNTMEITLGPGFETLPAWVDS